DRPAVNRIDGAELREIQGRRLGGRNEPVELVDVLRGGSRIMNKGEIRIGLHNMPDTIQSKGANLDSVVSTGRFEGGFNSRIEDGTENSSVVFAADQCARACIRIGRIERFL